MAKFKRYKAPLVEDEERKSNVGSAVENGARPIKNRGITTSHGKGFDAAAKKTIDGADKKEGKRTFAHPEKQKSEANANSQKATQKSNQKPTAKVNAPTPGHSGAQKSVQSENFTTANSSGHRAIVKTNYCRGEKAQNLVSAASGYGNSHGRKSKVTSGKNHAQSSATYYDRERAQSEQQRISKKEQEIERGEKLSNTYNRDCNRMTKTEFNQYQTELANANIQGMRRIVIAPEPSLNVNEQEMISITRDAVNLWAEKSGKDFEFTFAVHDGQAHIHSHVLMYSQDAKDINMQSKQLETFKGLVDDVVEQTLEARLENAEELDQALVKDIVHGLDEELMAAFDSQTQENNLSL